MFKNYTWFAIKNLNGYKTKDQDVRWVPPFL